MQSPGNRRGLRWTALLRFLVSTRYNFARSLSSSLLLSEYCGHNRPPRNFASLGALQRAVVAFVAEVPSTAGGEVG